MLRFLLGFFFFSWPLAQSRAFLGDITASSSDLLTCTRNDCEFYAPSPPSTLLANTSES